MEGGARPLVVGGVICLVYSGNERDARLSNSLAVYERHKRLLGDTTGSSQWKQGSNAGLSCPKIFWAARALQWPMQQVFHPWPTGLGNL